MITKNNRNPKIIFPSYHNMIPKNKKYLLEINIDPDPDDSKYKYHFELTLPVYYESALEKLSFDLVKKYKIKIASLKQRFPNSSLIFYSKSNSDVKKYILTYLKFINDYSYKESLHYPQLLCQNMKYRTN